MAFAKLKAHLCRIGARAIDDVSNSIGSICRTFTPTDCSNYMRHAGYAPELGFGGLDARLPEDAPERRLPAAWMAAVSVLKT